MQIQSVAQESKEWVEKNRVCDAPGSWFCRGQYPPALTKILKEKKDFKQLEDFNIKEGDDSEYQKEYFENLNRGASVEESDGKVKRTKKPKDGKQTLKRLSETEIEKINSNWENNEATTLLHHLIEQNDGQKLQELLLQEPKIAHLRSEDGRGPMFWAHEYGRKQIVQMLKALGVSEIRKDSNGNTPLDQSKLV
jgi:dolichyl-diphosphooligosaccharide---protein glycosyltransferase